MGQEDGEKWTAAAGLQSATPKSDRLLAYNLSRVEALIRNKVIGIDRVGALKICPAA